MWDGTNAGREGSVRLNLHGITLDSIRIAKMSTRDSALFYPNSKSDSKFYRITMTTKPDFGPGDCDNQPLHPCSSLGRGTTRSSIPSPSSSLKSLCKRVSWSSSSPISEGTRSRGASGRWEDGCERAAVEEMELGSVRVYMKKRDEEGTDGNMLGKRRRLCEYGVSRLIQQG